MASGNFCIDDAFQSDEEDPIRVYGTIGNEATALTSSSRSTDRGQQQSLGYHPVPLGRDYDLTTSVNSDGSNEINDTCIGLLSGQTEGANIYRTGSAYSFGSSSIENTSLKTNTERHWWKHPRVKDNWKIVLAAFILLVIGLGLFVAGITIEIIQTQAVQSFIFFIAGTMCLIPGGKAGRSQCSVLLYCLLKSGLKTPLFMVAFSGYHVIYIYCAVKGKKGFSLYNLPVFK